MICTKCGSECRDDSKFCNRCGATIEPVNAPAYSTEPAYSTTPGYTSNDQGYTNPGYTNPGYTNPGYTSGPVYNAQPVGQGASQAMVIIAMVLGIVSVFFGLMSFGTLDDGGLAVAFLLALPCAIVGMVLNSNVKKANAAAGVEDSGMTKAGFICSIVGLGLIALLMTAAMFDAL